MKTINPLSSQFPDDDSNRPVQVPTRDSSGAATDRQVAAEIVRGQLHRLYENNPPNQLNQQPAHKSEQHDMQPAGDPYDRTHQSISSQAAQQSEAWKKYHSAWQQYYQQYYQRYYMQQLEEVKQKAGIASHSGSSAKSSHSSKDISDNPHRVATSKIHDEIVGKVKKQATGLRHSSHFMPILTAIFVGVFFMFLQYNRLFTAQVKAYVVPGSTASQSIILDPVTNTKVGPEPRIIIPKINVDAPIVYGVNSLADGPVQVALRDGVVHYPLPGANSVPGQAGNTVLLGHSSNDVFDSGQYKFVFVLLERLEEGDTFYLHNDSVRYTYRVTKKEVIDPTEVNKLIVETDKPLATLVTCVPPGTALKRLVVWAEQISPDPSNVAAAPTQSRQTTPTNIAGDGSSFLERLFGN